MSVLHIVDNSAVCLQAQFQAIETRARQAQETLTQHEAEAVKLEQRLAAAREQYDSGLSKLRSTAQQLESLASQARHPSICCCGQEAGHSRNIQTWYLAGRGSDVASEGRAGYACGLHGGACCCKHGGHTDLHILQSHDHFEADACQAARHFIPCGQAWTTAGCCAGAQVRSTEQTGRNLILDLRELPSKQALGLRSEVAMQARWPAPPLLTEVCISGTAPAGDSDMQGRWPALPQKCFETQPMPTSMPLGKPTLCAGEALCLCAAEGADRCVIVWSCRWVCMYLCKHGWAWASSSSAVVDVLQCMLRLNRQLWPHADRSS